MSQQTSQATQEKIDELIRRTQEKEEERKKKRKELQAGEAAMSGSSQEHQSEPTKGQETTIATSKAGCTVLIKCTSMGNKSEKTRKADDKSRQEEEVDVEEQKKTTAEHGSESTEGNDDFDDEPSVVEFEDPIYELSQSYELEPEYEDMTLEQEAAEVQALTPIEQAEYRELTKLHQCQAELEKKMTGMLKVITERTKAQTPGLPADFVKRNIQIEPLERQELHQMTEEWRVRALIKQDDIPRADKPGTSKGYYLFVKDDAGCMIEQGDGRMVRDMDTDQRLPTDLITKEEAAMYQVPEQDDQVPDDDAETISSTSTANYDQEEVETSLTSIAEAFHTTAQEYEKLTSTVPHMSKVQATQVIARLPILPALKQELKAEKIEVAETTETEPVPGTSQRPPAAEAERLVEVPPEEVIPEPTAEEKEDEPDEENVNEYFKKYMLTGKGKDPEEKIQEACKEINYWNLIILIAVRDYVVNKAKNIKEVTGKWGLSFSTVQCAMLHKKEHSVGGRQYAKRKRMAEKQEGPTKKSQHLKEKQTTEPARVESPQPTEQSQDSSDSRELPDVPWTWT